MHGCFRCQHLVRIDLHMLDQVPKCPNYRLICILRQFYTVIWFSEQQCWIFFGGDGDVVDIFVIFLVLINLIFAKSKTNK